MQATTLSFENLHAHGSLFSDLLRARHKTFIQRAQWDLPQADGMEFDQYDTPASRWVAVHEYGRILAGVRLTPTTHRCAIYSYMIRDAQRGLLGSIPADLMYEEAPVAPHVWEGSRIFVARDVPGASRLRVQLQLLNHMVNSARELGATSVVAIMPAACKRMARRLSMDWEELGPVRDIDGVDCVCIRSSLAVKMH
jgi:N-acyl-L-homoserine lactone synthetase